MANSTYLLGVDGGGTKTDLLLVDASTGETVATHTAPGCNPSHIGADAAGELLQTALDAVRGDRTIARTALYMAGSPATWVELGRRLRGAGEVTTGTDALPVLELATGGAPGLVLHAGTGSFIAARAPDGTTHYAGGLGWRFGDPGSASDIGRRAIAAALLELQGWAPATALGAALREHAGLDDAAAITRACYSRPDANALIAGFARRVVVLAQEGCRPAQVALAGSLAELVAQARLVTDRLFAGAQDIPCGVSGALLNGDAARYALLALAQNHGWPVSYRFLAEPPIEGVRRLLLKQ